MNNSVDSVDEALAVIRECGNKKYFTPEECRENLLYLKNEILELLALSTLDIKK